MAYLGLLAYLFLLYIRPADWVPAVQGWRFDFVILGIVSALVIPLHLTPDTRIRTPHMLFLIGWLASVLLSNLLHGNLNRALNTFDTFGKFAITFFLFLYVINSSAKLTGVILTMSALSATLAIQGIYQVEHGVGWAEQPLYWGGRIVWVGLWDGANSLSLLFLTSLPFLLEFLLAPWTLPYRLYAFGAGAFVLGGLYLAASRGAWLTLLLLTLLYSRRRFAKAGILAGSVVIAILVLAVAPSRLSQLSLSEKSANSASSRYRVYMWAKGFEMLRYNRLFGVGKGQFVAYTHRLAAHNSFIQHMGETGLVGLFFSIGLVYYSFKSLATARALAGTYRLRSLERGLWASLVAYLCASIFITTDFDTFYIMLALSTSLAQIARRETEIELPGTEQENLVTLTRTDIRNILMIEVGGILCFYLATNLLSGV